MKRYESPNIEIKNVEIGHLLSTSETEPGATSIGSPSVSNDAKAYSIWDELNEQYNIMEEQNYGEDWI